MSNYAAAYAVTQSAVDPLAGLVVGAHDELAVPPGWSRVFVRASALNHHDLWSLRGVGLPGDRLPMILGTDAAGVDEHGNDVVVHAVIGEPQAAGEGARRGDDSADPLFSAERSLLSERYPGTLATWVAVPAANLIPKPAQLSFAQAACLPTAWLTAYRMLTTKGRLGYEGSVLVQGAGGGVATAAVLIGRALGARVYVTGRSPEKRDRVTRLGAVALEPGARLPERVDVVIDTVGEVTFDHSLKCAKPAGRIVVAGATSGHLATVDLRRVFYTQLEILGSTMGTREELAELIGLVAAGEVSPIIDGVYPFAHARRAFERLASGQVFGKVVLDHTV